MAHKDGLPRFGSDGFEHCARLHGCTMTVVNPESLSLQEGMVEALMAIVPTFFCRPYGRRAGCKQIREAACDGREA